MAAANKDSGEQLERVGKEPFVMMDFQFEEGGRNTELRASTEFEFKTVLDQVPSLGQSSDRTCVHGQYFVENNLRQEYTLRYTPATYDTWPMNCCRQDSFGTNTDEKNDFHDWMEYAVQPKEYNRFFAIVVNHPTTDEHFRVMEGLEEISNNLCERGEQLGELAFINFRLDTHCPEDMAKNYTKSLTKLLKAQNEVKKIILINTEANLDRAFRILKSIRQGPCLAGHVKYLDITGFFAVQSFEEAGMMMGSFISELWGLEELRLDLITLDNLFLEALSTSHGTTLRKLSITVGADHHEEHEILAEAWEEFVNMCPNVQIDATVYIADSRWAIEKVLKPEMPLTVLELSLKHLGQEHTLVCESIVEYIVKNFSHALESLTMKINTGEKSFHGNIVSLMKKMKLLRVLRVHALLPLSKCLLIAHARLENETHIRHCHLHCICRTDLDIRLMRDELQPMFAKVRARNYKFFAYVTKYRPERADGAAAVYC